MRWSTWADDSLVSGPQATIRLELVGAKSSVIVFIITCRIVVCAIGCDKRVFCACILSAVNYYITVANYQPAGSGVVRLLFLAIVCAYACLR